MSIRRVGVGLLLALLTVTGCVAVPPPQGSASGCGKPASPVHAQPRLLLSGGVVRQFLLTIPDGYQSNVPAPLVLNFHGDGANGEAQAFYSGLDLQAMRRGFIVATPDGLPRGPGGLDGFDRTFDVDEPSADFTFVEDLVRYLDSILCVSPTERFSAGMSRGGQLSSRLVCLPELRLKAFAGVTALKEPCANATRVPVLAFQGTADNNVRYADIEDYVGSWAARNGCRRTPRESRIEPDIVVRRYVSCRGHPVTFYVVEGGGHTWPGASLDLGALISSAGRTTQTIDATDLILDFFEGS